MSKYLHNRIGTYLKGDEVQNVRKEEKIKEFKRGQLYVVDVGGSYKFVLYVKTNTVGIHVSHEIFTNNDPSITNPAPSGSLYSYSQAEPIQQTFKPTEYSLNDDDLLETYTC